MFMLYAAGNASDALREDKIVNKIFDQEAMTHSTGKDGEDKVELQGSSLSSTLCFLQFLVILRNRLPVIIVDDPRSGTAMNQSGSL